MIISLKKYLIVGAMEDKDPFFSLAQREGMMEFIGLSHKKGSSLPPEGKLLLSAIKIAKQHSVDKKEMPPPPLEPLFLAEMLCSLQREIDALLEQEKIHRLEMARVAPFGDFSKEDLEQCGILTKRKLQFFCSATSLEDPIPPEFFYLTTEGDLDYFFSISQEKISYPKRIEVIVDRPIGELRQQMLVLQEQIASKHSDIRLYSHTLPLLQKGLIDICNEHTLLVAKEQAIEPMNAPLFAVEAWVPEHRVEHLQKQMGRLALSWEEIAVEAKDRPPTYMENRGVPKIGEDLVHIYDTPSPTDKDPSPWVLWFFALFFAMILSDAGYGTLFLLSSWFLRWKLRPLVGFAKRFVRLLTILSWSCIVWGVATSSYFGIELSPTSPLRRTSITYYLSAKKGAYHLEQKDDVYREYLQQYPRVAQAQTGEEFLQYVQKTEGSQVTYPALDDFSDMLLMEFSFLVGMLHISLSLLRYVRRKWSNLGWVVFILGGYLYFPSIIHASTLVHSLHLLSEPMSQTVGLWLTLGGMGWAFLFAIPSQKWGAFNELLAVVQVFSDVLSYLRLYALALGGMVMAKTFNTHLGIDVGWLGAALIIFIGHVNNITLSIMGGVIHGLRLNFLEWYHYSFEGDGKLFNPLRIRK